MEQAIIQTLMDYGALGLFAGYLAWQQNKLQQALQDLTRRFQEQIDNLQTRHEAREDTMRARYDAVIADLNSHRDEAGKATAEAIIRTADKLGDLETQIRDLRLAVVK